MDVDDIREAQVRQDLRAITAEVLAIEEDTLVEVGGRQALRLRGQLLRDSQEAYGFLAPRFQDLGHTALLRREDGLAAVVAVPGVFARERARVAVALVLFVLTVLSTLYVGGQTVCADATPCQLVLGAAADGTAIGINLGLGLAYSAALLGILVAHEFGHFLVARRVGMASTYPYFIPMPFPPLGTMGAVIALKTPPPSRRALLAVGIAGPLAGMVVAIPVLLIGLWLSNVEPLPTSGPYFLEGNSLLYGAIKFLVFGRWLPGDGLDVFLHPVALAGWAGLLVTGLNLLPAGQLDGGHIMYALVGRRWASRITWALILVIALMGTLWTGWYLWAALLFLFGQQHAVPLDDITPLRGGWRLLALAGLVLFALVFTPIPFQIMAG